MKTAGITVSGNNVIVTCAKNISKSGWVIESDQTIRLPSGDRPSAYHQVHQQCYDFLRENKVEKVAIKASALTMGSMKKAHLEGAELRGVVMAAIAASGCEFHVIAKSTISRTFGDRKTDEYIADDDFWSENFQGDLRKGSRESALLILATDKH